jgi:nucleoside-diphosphate-sugar epimerase
MKILVVGGAGYIGGYVTDLLLINKFKVTVFDNLLYENRYLKNVNFVFGDITDYKKINKELQKKYDVVIWLAALVGDGACAQNPEITKKINYEAVVNMLSNYRGKIIFMSTCSVYGQSNELLNENSKKNPLSLYAKTKIDAEKIIIKKNKNACIFRLGTLYGLGDDISRIRLDLVVNILTMKAALKEPLEVFGGNQWRPLLHVKDVAYAILFVINNNVKGIFNVSAKNYKIKNLAMEIKKEFNNKIDLKISKMMFEDTRNYKVTSKKLNSLGWLPRFNLKEGIKDIKKIIKENRIKNINDIIYSNAKYINKIYK